jgi:hypothetical protein
LRPLEEPLLDREVIQQLLPRLAAKYPDLKRDIIGAYHDLLQGKNSNTVFGNGFKVIEELAHRITGQRFTLSDNKALNKYFGKLHGTILVTIAKLADHRGDKGGHHRKGPDPYEMRYLLFSICNIALLFLEYQSSNVSS